MYIFGFAMYVYLSVRNWPVSMLKYIRKDFSDPEISEIEKRSKGEEVNLFPKMILVGYNVTGSALQCMHFLSNEIKIPNFETKVISIGRWEKDERILIRKRLHLPVVHFFKPWDEWKSGDIAQNSEWLDSDWIENPLEILNKLPDGRLEIQTAEISRGKKKRVGKFKIVPFLANYIPVKLGEGDGGK